MSSIKLEDIKDLEEMSKFDVDLERTQLCVLTSLLFLRDIEITENKNKVQRQIEYFLNYIPRDLRDKWVIQGIIGEVY